MAVIGFGVHGLGGHFIALVGTGIVRLGLDLELDLQCFSTDRKLGGAFSSSL
jgi:hypothetical protein